MREKLKLAINDLIAGLLSWRIWLLLGWQDIRLRYRRSQLGPFWLTISMAITTYSMGFLYGHLFKMDLKNYFPFLACGLLTWTMIANIVNESTGVFVEATGYLRQMKMPYVIFVLRLITRNLVIFAHNVVAVIPVLIFARVPFGWHMLLALMGLAIIAINGVFYGMLLGMLGARFRDITQVVASFIQVIFFVTPIMWIPRVLPEKYQFISKFNPFAQFIDLVRGPLLGLLPTCFDYLFVLGFTLLGMILMLVMFCRTRHRIIYWL